MLVDVRHAKDGPQSLIPSIVGPCPHDRFSEIGVEVAKVARKTLFFPIETSARGQEAFKAITGREVDIARVWPFASNAPAHSRECDGGLIEGGPQLVNNLACDDVHDFWRGRIENDFCEFVAGLRLRIEMDPARVCVEKLPLGAFQLDEMVLCSL